MAEEVGTINALPYLVGGFGSFWILVLGYLYSLHRRQSDLQREMALLRQDV